VRSYWGEHERVPHLSVEHGVSLIYIYVAAQGRN